MIDLDRFKAVNDAGGHAAGDAVLRQVAQTCTSTVRSSDIVARLGGDEFAIMLDNCPKSRAESIADTILRGLNPLAVDWQGTRFEIGASLGLAMYDPDMKTETEWLTAADDACYAAKREGRGCLRVAGRP
jgi:diguanylate cyclase (GGDEF)-like protein